MNDEHFFVLDILKEHYREELRPEAKNGIRERITAVAWWACQKHEGDILEIGAYKGETTAKLLEVAARFGRHVLVVDPWQKGTQNCKGGEYKQFLKNTASHEEYLEVMRLPSQDDRAVEEIESRELAFAFVDGLHEYDACGSDIMACAHAGIIAVDDVRPFEPVRRAFYECAKVLDRRAVTAMSKGIREGYLL